MNTKKILGWSAGLLVGLTLLACGGTKPSEGTSGKGDPGQPAASESAGSDGPVVAALGGKGLVFTDEKIDVAISKPAKYKPSQYMDRVPAGSVGFVLTVTVVNNNTQAIKVEGLQVTVSVGAAGAEAEEVYDSGAGIKGTPSSAVLPGKKATFKVAFTAPATEAHPELSVSVTPYDQGGSHTGLFKGAL